MGCDIHIVLEKKFEDRWIGLREMGYLPVRALEIHAPKDTPEPNFIKFRLKERDYKFFNAIAQVRGYAEDEEGLPPRGLPADASELSRVLFEDDEDMHTPSFLSLTELIPIIDRVKNGVTKSDQVAKVLLNERKEREAIVNAWIDYYIDEVSFQDYRIVFAFDN